MADNSLESFFDELNTDPDFRAHSILARLADHLAPRIKSLREKLGLSQADLAQKLGTKQSQISRFEDPDYSKYSLMSLARLADAFNCDLRINFVQQSIQSTRVTDDACYWIDVLSKNDREIVIVEQLKATNNVIIFPPKENKQRLLA